MKNLFTLRLFNLILLIALIPLLSTCTKKDPPPKPVAYFTYYPNTNLVAPVTLSFTNKSENANSYLWTYGTGLTDTDKDIVLTASSDGTYTVTLTVKGDGGTDTYSRTITVTNSTPPPSAQTTAGFTYSPSQNLVAPAKITFTNTSKNADSNKWDFNDGTTSTDVNPVKEFTKAGTYKVKLTATGKNNSNEFSADIIINNPAATTPPVADFSYTPATVTIEDNVFFTNKSTNALSFIWDFDDGTTSTLKEPTKKFGKAGNYTVKLKASGSNGTVNEVSKTITVTESTATVSFFTKTDFGFGKINLYEGTQPGLGYGTISTIYTNGITCGSSNNTVKIAPRTLNWVGEAENGIKWAGTVQLEAGKCYPIELTRNNIINGIVTFWTKTDLKVGKISVAVNGVAQGDITHYNASGVTCGYGDVNAKFNVGTYKFKATAADGSTWEDNVTFDRGVCNTRELVKSSTPPPSSCDIDGWSKTYIKTTAYTYDPKGCANGGQTNLAIQNISTIDLYVEGWLKRPNGQWSSFGGKLSPGKELKDWICGKALDYRIWAMPSSKSCLFGDCSCKFPNFP